MTDNPLIEQINPTKAYLLKEVAAIMRVDPKTVTRWIKQGKYGTSEYFKTGGGHHRIMGAGLIRSIQGKPVPGQHVEDQCPNCRGANRERGLLMGDGNLCGHPWHIGAAA